MTGLSLCVGVLRGGGRGVTKRGEAEGQMILKAALKSADPRLHMSTVLGG